MFKYYSDTMHIPTEILDYAHTEGIDPQNIYKVDCEELLDPNMLAFRKETGFSHCQLGEQHLVIARNSTVNNGIVYALINQINLDILMRVLQGEDTIVDRLRFYDISVKPPIIIDSQTTAKGPYKNISNSPNAGDDEFLSEST